MNRPDSRLPLSAFLALTAFTTILSACAPAAPTDTASTSSESAMAASSVPAAMEASSQAHAGESAYNDGTYTAEGDYMSPAGAEKVGVTLTLSHGVVADAQFIGMAENPASVRLQEQFNQGFKEAVVGKPIDELNLTIVNGSSLTPQGFMDAVAKIKAEARA